MSKYCLGIDTSNYKTSVAIVDDKKNIIFNRSEFLEVEHGKRGLRQSIAFFKHVNVLPSFIKEAFNAINSSDIECIAVSSSPRRITGSYMPVFLAGKNAAALLSYSLGVPLYEYSHQEGHVSAILKDYPYATGEDLIFFHLSGGTTEALLCRSVFDDEYHIESQIIGGTKDISIGQLLDRTGVLLGYEFPSGKYLDEIAVNSEITEMPTKIRIKNGEFNLSGIEYQILNSIKNNRTKVIPGLMFRISELLYNLSKELTNKYAAKDIFMAGGVAASTFIRNQLEIMNAKDDFKIHFGDKELSGDNAVGIALLGERAFHESIHNNSI